MSVQNMGAAVFRGLPVRFPVGVETRTQGFQRDMATFLELWLAACWWEDSVSAFGRAVKYCI